MKTSGLLCIALSGASLLGTEVAFSQTVEAGADEAAISEIVVTATRRNERLQDVPLDVNALSAEQLANTGFKDLVDIQYTLPGVYFGTTPNDAGFRLRGVGTAGGFSSSSEQNVGVVVDGVVVPFGAAPIASLGDIDHIEVLKGPQGTQFGKNASSGVVSVTTQRPNLTAVQAEVFGSYGSLSERDIHGMLSVPFANGTAAAQLFAFNHFYHGFVDNVIQDREWGGLNSSGARAKLLWEPSADFSAYFIADYSRSQTTGPGQLWTLNRLPATYDPFFNPPFVNLAKLGVTPGDKNNTSVEDYSSDNTQANYGTSLQLDYYFDGYTLTSVSAYRALKNDPAQFAIDASPLPRFESQNLGSLSDFVSEEFRLTSPKGERFEYIAGVFASRLIGRGAASSTQLRPDPTNPGFIVSISDGLGQASTYSKSQALFSDGSLKLTDQFRLLGGLRITHDQVTASNGSVIDPNLPGFDPPPPFGTGPSGTVPYQTIPYSNGSTSKTDWSGRFGPELKLTDDAMFFATYARGYLGPTITYSILTATRTTVQPQTVDDVTVGTKLQFLDRRLTLNADVFYDKYKNLQTSVFNGLEFLTVNAGGLVTKGFEIDSSYQFTKGFTASLGYAYADAHFTDYVTACPPSVVIAGTSAIAGACDAPGSTASTPLFQAAGQQLPGAPKSTVTAALAYAHPVTNNLSADLSTNFYYRSASPDAAGDTLTVQKGYGIVNLNAGLGSSSDKWRIGFFVRNLADRNFQAGLLALPFASPGGVVNWETREGRRTVGVSLEARY